ncbi:GNAT family N-acetyltransferase [Streptomyces sp. NPDC079189]|uniref:GNAT family N-acetyltransferase n=1 Tax=Streptomyces sp. NPDC079189 TaxID=3154514 RepID=UPI003440B739
MRLALTCIVAVGRSWLVTRELSTPPAVSFGLLSGSLQPVLPAAQGLLLRPWEPADGPVFLSAYQDDEICRWHTRRPQTETRVLEWFDAYHQDWGSEKGGHWAVARKDGEVLGRIALRGFDFNDGVADVSYWVLPTARGRGVATSAMAALSTLGTREPVRRVALSAVRRTGSVVRRWSLCQRDRCRFQPSIQQRWGSSPNDRKVFLLSWAPGTGVRVGGERGRRCAAVPGRRGLGLGMVFPYSFTSWTGSIIAGHKALLRSPRNCPQTSSRWIQAQSCTTPQ